MNVEKELQDLEAIVEHGGDGMAMVREFVRLDMERKKIADQLKQLEYKCAELQAPVLEYMSQTGMTNTRVDGRLVHIVKRHKVVPKEGMTKDDVCRALTNTGHGDIVTTSYHWTRMSALAKQAEDDGVDLPSELLSTIEVKEEFKVQTRK